MKKFPRRPRNHEIETLSENYFRSKIPSTWIIDKPSWDYGIDYHCGIVIDEMVTGINFSIQLKGKEKEKNKTNIQVTIKRSTINLWLIRLEPIMIITFIVEENKAYWIWFENNTVDLTLDQKTFTINIPRTNKLEIYDWNICSEYVTKIFKNKNSLNELPNFNNVKINAWELYKNGNYKKALPLFYDILEKDPKNGMLLELLSLCEYKLFNYQSALILINQALEISNNKSYLSNKAAILTEQGYINKDNLKINEAILIYKKLITENFTSETIYYNLGSALGKIGEFKNSIYYLNLASELNPNRPDIWNNLGNSYMNLENHNLEIECYNKALKINPNQAETLFSKGSTLFKYFKNTTESLDLMLKSAAITDRYKYDNPNFFFWLAQVYISRNQIKEAKSWNSEGLKCFSSNKYLIEQSKIIEK